MIKNIGLIICSVILFSSCENTTYTKEDCIKKTKNFIDSNFDSVVFIKKDRFGATNKLYLKMKNKDSVFQYKTQSAWPLIQYFERGDILNKVKGDSIPYITKEDTVLRYQYACDQMYINGKPI